ncbi:MAG: type II toxin-antitoxin system VapC family toxin [Nitrospinae bacterium]|nr:type II toxin-antitoxin system VapC family toxin [Nitrospinota bacterium]
MKFMLDTDTCVFIIRRKGDKALWRLKKLEPGEAGLSIVTVAELRYGAAKSGSPQVNNDALDGFFAPFEIAGFDEQAAMAYGPAREQVEKRGSPIGAMDMMIAAHAISLGAVLVTHNTREFSRVKGLAVEDWIK